MQRHKDKACLHCGDTNHNFRNCPSQSGSTPSGGSKGKSRGKGKGQKGSKGSGQGSQKSVDFRLSGIAIPPDTVWEGDELLSPPIPFNSGINSDFEQELE